MKLENKKLNPVLTFSLCSALGSTTVLHSVLIKSLMGKLILGFIFLTLFFSLNSYGQQKKTYVAITFDVEDYISPESVQMDDIPKWLAETLTEEGVTGTFFVIGEKARSLKSRGREDVINAMNKHNIGSHTNYGSIHPTVTEILETPNWDEGYQIMQKNEMEWIPELEKIFKAPINSFARHGGSYGPQLVAALGSENIGYAYSPAHLPNKNAVWFCNALNFHSCYSYLDNLYYKDELFNPALDSIKEEFPNEIKDLDVLLFLANHPSKIKSEQFWDFNYYKGANPTPEEWKVPDLRPQESMVTARKNFRRLVRYLKDNENVELVGLNDLMELYSEQREFIEKEDLINIAKQITEEKTIISDEYYSPAEVFNALVESISNYSESGELPDKLKRKSPLGPRQMPPVAPTVVNLTPKQVKELALTANKLIKDNGFLPSELNIAEGKIGTGSLLYLFSSAYQDMVNNENKSLYKPIPLEAYPTVNEEAIINEIKGMKHWEVHRPDLNMARVIEFTRLQLWTLKPAHEKVN